MAEKLTSVKKVLYAQVFQDNLHLFSVPVDTLGKIPEGAVNPVMVIFYYILTATIELEDGAELDTTSEPFAISQRHFWGGEEVPPDPNTFEDVKRDARCFLGRDWENDRKLHMLRFDLNCGNCDELHEFLFPCTSEDIIHSVDEWNANI